jgi:hypothetical protein
MPAYLENVRCKFCQKLFPRPIADSNKPKECVDNKCLRRRRFIIGGIRLEEPVSNIVLVIRRAMLDRSQKAMNE